jgi:hypothetical protein
LGNGKIFGANPPPSSPPVIKFSEVVYRSPSVEVPFEARVSDSDGDITRIYLKYQWEGEEPRQQEISWWEQTYSFNAGVNIPVPRPFSHLRYQLVVIDREGNKTLSPEKSFFYLHPELLFTIDGNPDSFYLAITKNAQNREIIRESVLSYWEKIAKKLSPGFSWKLMVIGDTRVDLSKVGPGNHLFLRDEDFLPGQDWKSQIDTYLLRSNFGSSWQSLPFNLQKEFSQGYFHNKGMKGKILGYLEKNQDREKLSLLFAELGKGTPWDEAIANIYGMNAAFLSVKLWFAQWGILLITLILVLGVGMLSTWRSFQAFFTK